MLWHWAHYELKSQLVARQIIASVEKMSIKVFPNISTCWHFDDKVGQKYLLESVGAPLVPTYIFFDKQEAMDWIDKTEFPKVFKLRCGAGSQNVKLVKTKKEAKKLCKRSFRGGFTATSGYFGDFKRKVRQIKSHGQLMDKLWRMPETIYNALINKYSLPRQRGYIYFQDFLPDNNFDTRITIIGNRAFGFRRNTRPNDFRASGSGDIIYDIERIDKRCIQVAFRTVKKLKTQSLAFDFVFDKNGDPKIAEISYCYQNKAVYNCQGYWDDKMNWHAGHIWPEDVILIDLINDIQRR